MTILRQAQDGISSGDWLTVQAAAKLSGYDPEHIRRLVREGAISAQKFSIVWQVSQKSLLEYAANAQNIGKKRGPKPKK